MEYAQYILVVLGILAFTLGAIHLAERARPSPESARERQKQHEHGPRSELERAPADATQTRRLALQRELQNVPIPWGWPGHDDAAMAGLSGTDRASASLHRWVDRLVREKRTLEDEEYQSKRAASLRTMMEDRYGRSSRMQQMEYQKVKPPLLRDPSAPHDQMDNFPSGKGDQIAERLRKQPAAGKQLKRPRLRKVSGLEGIKTPWGW